jgi:hypothetical protein
MSRKKQRGNSGEDPPPERQEAARRAFVRMFPEPSPLTWTAESLTELEAILHRLKAFHGQYQGTFLAPSDSMLAANPPALRRRMDKYGQAKQLLTAVKLETMITGEQFDFAYQNPPEDASRQSDQQGTITMSRADYHTLQDFVRNKKRDITRADRNDPPGR